jgi:hypothetical protein
MFNKKEILKYIRKYAEEPETVHIPTPSSADRSVKLDGPYKPAIVSPAIGEMQEAIYDLSQKISPATQDFNDFMVESYSTQSLIKGQEWDPSVVYPELKTNKPTDLIQLNNVISQLQKIGSRVSPRDPDGVWDYRTQNAVKNVWAFADALLRVYDDFGASLPNPSFTSSDLQRFGQNIPETPYNKPEKIKKYKKEKLEQSATIIAPIIEKLNSFYVTFFKRVLSNPDYQKYIKETKTSRPTPFNLNLKPTSTVPQMPADADISNKILKDIELPKVNGQKISTNVPLTVLQDQKSLQRFLFDVLDYPESQIVMPNIQLNILNMIKTEVNSRLKRREEFLKQ